MREKRKNDEKRIIEVKSGRKENGDKKMENSLRDERRMIINI